MSDNLIPWLAPYVQKEGKIGYSRRAFKEVREAAGIEWSKDVMRHCFGSYLLAHNEDAPKTAMQMGHSGVDVLFNHYRNLVKKQDAVDYWNIEPDNKAQIIQFPVAKVG
jgi:integrase